MSVDFVAEVSSGQLESLERLDVAVRSVAAIVFPNPVYAAAGLMGCGLAMMVEQGLTEEMIVSQLRQWFAVKGDLRAAIARRMMRVVPGNQRCNRLVGMQSMSCSLEAGHAGECQ